MRTTLLLLASAAAGVVAAAAAGSRHGAAVAVAAPAARQQEGARPAAAAAAPTGLLVDYKRSPSLGVRTQPAFSWVVPACSATSADHHQTAYRIVVSARAGSGSPKQQQPAAWDSGKVASNASTYVEYAGRSPLLLGTSYTWAVTTWTESTTVADTACQSAPSPPGLFVTSLGESAAWHSSSHFVSLPAKLKATFAYFRKDLAVPSDVATAVAFVTALNSDPMLSAYKLYIDGELVNLGPGRGEAPVWGGDGVFRSLPYYTLDITRFIVAAKGKGSTVTVALQTMHVHNPSAMLQINFELSSGKVVTVGTDKTWSAFNGDAHRNPGAALHGHSAGTSFLEYIDARREPVGWKAAGFKAGAGWGAATATAPTSAQLAQLHPKMQPPMEVMPSVAVVTIRAIAPNLPPPPGPAPLPPPGPPATCVDAAENQIADIGCPEGKVIGSILFASFGTPTGSCSGGFKTSATCNSNHSVAVVSAACLGNRTCKVDARCQAFHEKLGNPGAFCWATKKSLAVKVACKTAAAAAQVADRPALAPAVSESGRNSSWFLADFGKELQGGVILDVKNGRAGQTVEITCGESLSGNTVGSSWGWVQQWTLRDGAQMLEQHKYMECRFITLAFSGDMSIDGFTLSAWKVHYPWYDSDSHFSSSNATLNAVFELSRYTLDAASLDTYTDSNTRERRPYEADGIIASTARLLLQRDFLWGRHKVTLGLWSTRPALLSGSRRHHSWVIRTSWLQASLISPLRSLSRCTTER